MLGRVVALLLAIAALIAFWAWRRGAERRAVASLPLDQRVALFTRTRQTVESACANPPADLADYCRHEADFLLLFPECDRACERLAQERLSVLSSPR